MRRICLIFVLLGCLGSTAAADVTLPDFADLVSRVSPAVVNISTSDHDTYLGAAGDAEPGSGAADTPYAQSTLGAGIIISADGDILTNYHVVRGADEINVKLSDRRQLPATVVGVDAPSDLALIHVSAENLPVVSMGNPDALRVGEWVMAIGSPFGFDHSVTVGVVSAKGRSVGTDQYVPFIQTDAAINPGNSGGPLFNLDGQVVGINSQIYSETGGFMGVSFAIPSDLALDVAKQLKQHGRVSRGWLGVSVQDVTRELADSMHLAKPEGALVRGVMDKGPAAAAGLTAGDVIVAFGDKPVFTAHDLPPLVGRHRAGATVDIKVLRDGQPVTLPVQLAEFKSGQPAAATHDPEPPADGPLGMQLRDPTQAERKRYGTHGGAVVANIGGGPARDGGLRAGDLILSLGPTEITNAADLRKRLQALPPGKRIAVLVERDGTPMFLALKLPEAVTQ